jgi:hypothetical protein
VRNRYSKANIKSFLGRCALEFYHDICSRHTAHILDSNDLEWDGESKRIIAVGDGREKSVFIL